MCAARVPSQVTVDGRLLKVTNLDKVLYPATGTTKGEVIAYYQHVAPWMVPHVADRPATRKRWPNGVGTPTDPGDSFFQKGLDARSTPDWVSTAVLQLFLPWWVIVLVPFAVCAWRSHHPGRAYAVSLAAVLTVWLTYATFLRNGPQGTMSDRIAELFFLPNGAVLLLIISLVGGVVAGFAGLAGCYVRQLFVKGTLTAGS